MSFKSNKKNKKRTAVAIAHITASFNNTLITITDLSGAVIAWSSAGSNGFKGTRKATPYAATIAAEHAARKIQELGVKALSVELRGPGNGRDSAIRAFKATGITITTITDKTSIPHNGCRAPKKRRI